VDARQGASTSPGPTCQRDQIVREGRRVNAGRAAQHIVALARQTMVENDLKAVILRVDVGNRTLVSTGLGQSMAGVPATMRMISESARWRSPTSRRSCSSFRTRAGSASTTGSQSGFPNFRTLIGSRSRCWRTARPVTPTMYAEPGVRRRPPGERLQAVDGRRAARIRLRPTRRVRAGNLLQLRTHHLHLCARSPDGPFRG
jgi:hypothetical protein